MLLVAAGVDRGEAGRNSSAVADEGKREAADLAAEIMAAGRPPTPAPAGVRRRAPGDYVIRAALVIALLAFILVPVVVVVLTHPE